ncbi:MAG TPA: TIGR00159 family protein [Candidatus Avacidaminococcus intestinavium]|uniref:Diadenylate cyclase n=1 Tax=Candidatus Avacidaminococcus intestinavium TaxID=2840684 RepID=A0A9D1MNV2_9FIRM|nr:TIGR00159 family protein [Candidatus Avacidaminococcus intestinavium]
MFSQIEGIIKTMSLLDMVDIFVVTYFLYKLYQMLKNTRAASLVKGLLVLLIAALVSNWLNLHVINWLLEKSMTVMLVALPVVFQPELRRALEQIGRGRFFRKTVALDDAEVESMLDAVESAAIEMAKNKVGALIVFERETGLDDYVETGTRIDALVSHELFMNIFIPNTPLHDGAVIIRGNRIKAAGCLLPLTEARNLSKELGTRHRAALGLSEQSDALVLVISEETGTISLARGGALQRYLTGDDLKELLRPSVSQPILGWRQELVEKINSWRKKI